jgi:hypothetical protein
MYGNWRGTGCGNIAGSHGVIEDHQRSGSLQKNKSAIECRNRSAWLL